MEKISWTDHVRNEEVLLRVNEQRNILHEIRKRKANWIGHILRRNRFLKQVIERKIKGEMEVTRRRGRKRKKLLDDLKDRRGYSYLKEETLDLTRWRNRFGGGFGPFVRQNTEWMNIFWWVYSPIIAVGESNVREEIRNCISMYVVTADVGLLKNNMIKLIGWNGINIHIIVTGLWHPTVNVWRLGWVMCEAIYPHKQRPCSESIASAQFHLMFGSERPWVDILWNNSDKLTGMEQSN